MDGVYTGSSFVESGLPGWIAYANAWTIFLMAAGTSCAACIVACVVTYPKLDNAKPGKDSGMHWTELARRVDPLRRAMQLALVLFPVLFGALGVMNAGPLGQLPAYLMALVGGVGSVLGILPVYSWMNRKIGSPSIGLRHRFNGIMTSVLFIAPHVVLAAVLGMYLASGMVVQPLIFLGMAAGGTIALIFGLELRLARLLGVLVPAPEHVRTAAESAARKLGVPFPRTYLVRSAYANAYAWPHLHTIAVTEAAQNLLSSPELEAVLAHEVGHCC